MRISIEYFAWVRDAMGRSGESVDLETDDLDGGVFTVAALIGWLRARDAAGAAAFADIGRIRAARDNAMVAIDTRIDGPCCIALFPPVTGG